MGTAGNTRVLQRADKMALVQYLVKEVDFSQAVDTCSKLTLVLLLRLLGQGSKISKI